jgi:hypothetical protein
MANSNPVCKFKKGNKLGGRTPKIKAIQEFCRGQGVSILLELLAMFRSKKTSNRDKIEISKLLLAYGYGKPNNKIAVLAKKEPIKIVISEKESKL